MPAFANPVFEELYRKDFFIEEAVLREITLLGKEKAVPELLKIVEDTLAHFDAYRDEKEWHHNFYFLHAIYLLYELDAEEALPVVLSLLTQGHAFLEYWFSDDMYEDVPEILVRLGKNNLPALLTALNDSSYSLHSRNLIGKALLNMAAKDPEKRTQIIAFFRDHLRQLISHTSTIEEVYPADQDPSYGYNIYEYISFLLGDLQMMNAAELEPEMRECFRKELVDPSIIGSENEILFEDRDNKAPFSSIYQKYADFTEWLGEHSPFHPDAENIKILRKKEMEETRLKLEAFKASRQLPRLVSPVSNAPKVGRNDPCPCGSGKKYKKCCG